MISRTVRVKKLAKQSTQSKLDFSQARHMGQINLQTHKMLIQPRFQIRHPPRAQQLPQAVDVGVAAVSGRCFARFAFRPIIDRVLRFWMLKRAFDNSQIVQRHGENAGFVQL